MADLADAAQALLDDVLAEMEPMICRTPDGIGGSQPGVHCTACCGGTGFAVGSREEENLARLLCRMADHLRAALAAAPVNERWIKRPDGSRWLIQLMDDPLDGGYVAQCVDRPGVISQGDTEAEAMENVADAIEGALAAAPPDDEPLTRYLIKAGGDEVQLWAFDKDPSEGAITVQISAADRPVADDEVGL